MGACLKFQVFLWNNAAGGNDAVDNNDVIIKN